MQRSSTWDDRLLALDVETALKALGIAAGGDLVREGDVRLAMDDLRGAAPLPKRMMGSEATTPTLLADDSEIYGIR